MELKCRELEELLWDYGQNVQEKPIFVENNEVHYTFGKTSKDKSPGFHVAGIWQSMYWLVDAVILSVQTCTRFTMQDIFYKDNPKA